MKRFHGASMLVALVALAVMASAAVAQGVDVSAFEPRVSATPGEYVSVALSLTYHGTVSEAVEVVVQVPGPGWTFLSDRKRVTLGPEIPETVFMTFMPPVDLPAGEIVIRFRVLSVLQGLDVGGTEVRLTISQHVRLVVTAPGSASLAPDDVATYTFVVRNEGNTPVTASIRVQTELEGVEPDGETRMQLVAGETRPFPVTVRVPTEGAPQTARIVVDACVLPEGAACARGVLLLDILPPGPDAVPGIADAYFPTTLTVGFGHGQDPWLITASAALWTHGDLLDGRTFDVGLTFQGPDAIGIVSIAANLHSFLAPDVDVSLQRSDTSQGCGLGIPMPLGSLSITLVDDCGVQTGGRVASLRWRAGLDDVSLGLGGAASMVDGVYGLNGAADASWLSVVGAVAERPIFVAVGGEGHWTGPDFYGPGVDTWGYSLSAGVRAEDMATLSLDHRWDRSDVLGSAAVKEHDGATTRFAATASFDWASFRYEVARRVESWEPSPIENGWREKEERDDSQAWGLSLATGGFQWVGSGFYREYLQEGVRDDDGDSLFDEDPVDGVDNDGDNKMDEDGPNWDEHSVAGSAFLLSYTGVVGHAEVGYENSETHVPGKPDPVDEVHRIRGAIGVPVIDSVTASLSATVEADGEWEQQLDVRYAPEGSGLAATVRLRLTWLEAGAGSFEIRPWFGVDFEYEFLLASRVKVKGQVAGTVFVDDNGNGVRDAGEIGVPDVVLGMGGVRARTGEAGDYRLPAVKPGVYTLRLLALPANLRAGQTSTIVALEAGKVSSVDFALRAVGTVSGGVFDDSNQNGAWDEGEVGIPGAVVTLGSGADTQSARTNANGLFTFVGLVPGRYDVGLVVSSLPARWRPTTSTQVRVELGVGGEAAVAFGGYEPPREVAFTFRSSTLTFDVARPQGGEPWSREFTADPGASYGSETSFTWDFDGDADADDVGRIVTHTFPGSGRYVVTLTANGGDRVAKILDILDNEP